MSPTTSSTRLESRAWAKLALSGLPRPSPMPCIMRPASGCGICRSQSTNCFARASRFGDDRQSSWCETLDALPRRLDDFRHGSLVPGRHDVDAGNLRDVRQFTHHLGTDAVAFCYRVA